MASIKEVKDIYIENSCVVKKEHITEVDTSKFVFATPTLSTKETREVELSADIKNLFIENSEDFIIPEVVLRDTITIEGAGGETIEIGMSGQPLYNSNDYMTIIVYKSLDRKTPIFSQMYNMKDKKWVFYMNAEHAEESILESRYGITVTNNTTDLKTIVSNSKSDQYILCKIFSSKV